MSVSTDRTYWKQVVEGALPNVIPLTCEDQPKRIVFTFKPTKARYARFVVKSYHSHHGALQFFDIRGPPDCEI